MWRVELEDKAKKAARYKRWYDSHPATEERKGKKAQQQREWRRSNPALAKQVAKDRYRRDPTAACEKQRAWRDKHPDQVKLLQRVWALRNKYGITLEEYDALLAVQGGGCAICGSTEPGGPKTSKHFPVDHDHATGKIRGLLCNPCNKALGVFKDSPALLFKAIAYITK